MTAGRLEDLFNAALSPEQLKQLQATGGIYSTLLESIPSINKSTSLGYLSL